MKYRAQAKNSTLTALLGLVLFAAATIGFLSIIVRALILKFDGAVAVAQVTDTQLLHESRRSVNSPYAVQYHFQIPGSGRWYKHEEPMLIGQPHASVTRDAWLVAKKTGTIRVIYWRYDPSLNSPEGRSPLDGIICPSIAAVFTALLVLASLRQLFGRSTSRLFD